LNLYVSHCQVWLPRIRAHIFNFFVVHLEQLKYSAIAWLWYSIKLIWIYLSRWSFIGLCGMAERSTTYMLVVSKNHSLYIHLFVVHLEQMKYNTIAWLWYSIKLVLIYLSQWSFPSSPFIGSHANAERSTTYMLVDVKYGL
jgi:hypothetical protein